VAGSRGAARLTSRAPTSYEVVVMGADLYDVSQRHTEWS
jgi:hypothetical protein